VVVASKQLKSPMSSKWLPPEPERIDVEVETTDAQVARACYLAGWMPEIDASHPKAAAFGSGVEIPDRRDRRDR
jgi:hypothetical protein